LQEVIKRVINNFIQTLIDINGYWKIQKKYEKKELKKTQQIIEAYLDEKLDKINNEIVRQSKND
jgi:hypothetical protein